MFSSRYVDKLKNIEHNANYLYLHSKYHRRCVSYVIVNIVRGLFLCDNEMALHFCKKNSYGLIIININCLHK